MVWCVYVCVGGEREREIISEVVIPEDHVLGVGIFRVKASFLTKCQINASEDQDDSQVL